MRALIGVAVVLLLAGCAGVPDDPLRERGQADAMAEVVEEPAAVVAMEPEVIILCSPDDDDGIGGTGCQNE